MEQEELQKLYDTAVDLRELGIPLPPELSQRIADGEREYMRSLVLPALRDHVGELLTRLPLRQTLVVDYAPGQPLCLRVCHNEDLSDLEGAERMTAERAEPATPEPARRRTAKTRETGRELPSTLRVTWPDGRVVSGRQAVDTFCQTISMIGIKRVQGVGITTRDFPLISEMPDEEPRHQQRHVDGRYIMVCNSTMEKLRHLCTISDRLGLGLTVEIVPRD